MDETKKKKPEDLDEKDKKENPEPKSDEQEKEEQKPEDKPKGDESEKPAPDDKQADENGEGADKAENKPDKLFEKEEPKSEEKPAENAPDPKDEEILRLKTQIVAMELGVSADCMEDAVAIAESYVKNGKAEDINSALQAVVKKYPDMKADGKDGKPNGGFKIGADKPKQKNADEERLNDAFGIKKKK